MRYLHEKYCLKDGEMWDLSNLAHTITLTNTTVEHDIFTIYISMFCSRSRKKWQFVSTSSKTLSIFTFSLLYKKQQHMHGQIKDTKVPLNLLRKEEIWIQRTTNTNKTKLPTPKHKTSNLLPRSCHIQQYLCIVERLNIYLREI